MSNRQINTLVLGSNGLIGLHTVKLLLKNSDYKTVYAVSRKGLDLEHPKLIQIIADYNNIQEKISNLQIDVLFSCLGTTKKKTPNTKDYQIIDHDYPLLVANKLHSNGCKKMLIVTAIGANHKSRSFYLKLKGEIEEDLKKLGFDSLHIFQPSLITGNRSEYRFLEGVFSKLFKLINPLLFGSFKKYKSIEGEKIASAMVKSAEKETSGIYIYTTDKINQLA